MCIYIFFLILIDLTKKNENENNNLPKFSNFFLFFKRRILITSY